jgi:predicted metal-dependent enzyme (double-stranded beta helix superfamily)
MNASIPLVLVVAVAEIVDAAARPDPLSHVESTLLHWTRRLQAAGALAHEDDDDEVLLHAGPDLTIFHITLSPGLQYPPHDHHMDALIGIYRGSETNFIYPVEAGKLGEPQRRDFDAPALVHLAPHSVHSVANTGGARSGALHVYLGDLTRTYRQLWDFYGSRCEPFDNVRYLAGARPIAA